MPPNIGRKQMGSLSEEGTFIFAFREPLQIIFQGDTSTQSEITRNPRLHEEKTNTTYGRNRSTQTSGIIIYRHVLKTCTQDLKLDNSYRKHKINFLKNRKFEKEPNRTSINITCYSHEESATDLWHMAQQQETMFGWLTIWSSKFFVSALFCYALSHRD